MPAVSALPASTRPSGAGSTESSRPSAGPAILPALLRLGAMATALRGGNAAGLVLVGPVAYGLYMYTELAITGDLARSDGNSERWFPLLSALVTISGAVLGAGGRTARA